MNNDYILKVINLKKVFTDELATPLEVLKNINLNIKCGEYVSLMGESGSGKSTLLYQIGCLDTPSEGNILIDGMDIMNLNDTEKSKLRCEKIGFVFQFYNLIQNLTALENVELATEICKNSLSPKETLINVGLKDRINNFPAQLSGGEQQRVSIARALAKNPNVLLCDEPTGALDYVTGKQILKLLQDTCRKRKMTVIIITHNTAIAPMADKVIKFKSGKVEEIKINKKPVDIERIEW